MSLEGWTQEQIDEYEQKLLAEVPENQPIGNVTLRSRLADERWDEDLYWEIRNRLIERGILAAGRGKGGSVRRVPTAATQVDPSISPVAEVKEEPAQVNVLERPLYEPMIEVIKTKWAQDNRLDAMIAEITAAQGSRQTGGKWTRPDITVASVRTFPYVPGRHFDITTFEIKPANAIDVTVVYEALGHRRAATRAYALLHVPEGMMPELEAVIDEVCLEAKRFGVGVILAAEASDYDTWEELVEPIRHEPDPERLNEFLSQQVSQGFREQIVKWFK